MGSWQRNLGVVGVVGVVGGLLGCAGTRASAPPARTVGEGASEDALVADLLEHHRHHHHSGVLMLIAMSLDSLGLPADQQTRVERLQRNLLDKMRPAGEAERELMALLADGVGASKIDRATVDVAVARLANASAAVHDAAIDDLDQLHGLLAPPERAALVDKLNAHWALWKQANDSEHRPLAALSQELALTPEQIAKLASEAALEPPPLPEREVDAYLRDFDRAFRADEFAARNLPHANQVNRDMADWGGQRLARFCEAMNPMLSEEQRIRLVGLLREHESHDETQAVMQ